MRYYINWKTTGYYRKDSLKLAARCPVSGCWPSCVNGHVSRPHNKAGMHLLLISCIMISSEVVMVALWNRADHYILLPCGYYLSFYLFFISSPNLSGRRLDVYHTSTHGVALVRI